MVQPKAPARMFTVSKAAMAVKPPIGAKPTSTASEERETVTDIAAAALASKGPLPPVSKQFAVAMKNRAKMWHGKADKRIAADAKLQVQNSMPLASKETLPPVSEQFAVAIKSRAKMWDGKADKRIAADAKIQVQNRTRAALHNRCRQKNIDPLLYRPLNSMTSHCSKADTPKRRKEFEEHEARRKEIEELEAPIIAAETIYQRKMQIITDAFVDVMLKKRKLEQGDASEK